MITGLAVLIAYLIGAIPFALIVTKLAGTGDIRKLGSGNLGATNVWRVAGFKVAVWVFIGDIGKGVAAVLIAGFLGNTYTVDWVSVDVLMVLCAVAAVLGHVFPVYIGGKGGKGVNTALGAVGTLLPVEVLLSVLVFAVVVTLTRYVSLGSILGAIALPVALLLERFGMNIIVADIYLYLTLLLALLILLTHYQNIGRLMKGTENKFSFSGSKKETAHD